MNEISDQLSKVHVMLQRASDDVVQRYSECAKNLFCDCALPVVDPSVLLQRVHALVCGIEAAICTRPKPQCARARVM